MKTLRMLLLLLLALPAWAQYVANPQAGVSYPALTNAVPIVLTAPGSNDPKDKGRATVALGFDFPFYNRVYSQITVTSNGVLFLEPSTGPNTAADFPGNVAIPNGAEPNGVIAPLWDDLFGSNQTSALQRQPITGSNGTGVAIEFKDWSRWPSGFFLTFQVRLWQNGIIEFYYGQLTGMGPTPLTATIGIESASGTAGTRGLSNCNADCSLTSFDPNGTGTLINFIRFSPPAGVDLQALSLRVDSITQTASDLTIGTTFGLRNFGTVGSPTFNYGVYLSDDTIYDPGIDVPLLPALERRSRLARWWSIPARIRAPCRDLTAAPGTSSPRSLRCPMAAKRMSSTTSSPRACRMRRASISSPSRCCRLPSPAPETTSRSTFASATRASRAQAR